MSFILVDFTAETSNLSWWGDQLINHGEEISWSILAGRSANFSKWRDQILYHGGEISWSILLEMPADVSYREIS